MLGERIKIIRKENDMTQNDLAKAFDLSPSTIAMYESGNRNPDADTLKKMAAYFDVSVDYLLGITNIPNPPEKIKNAISNDPELLKFWKEVKNREELQTLLKQSNKLDKNTIKQIIQIIKTFEEKEGEKYGEER